MMSSHQQLSASKRCTVSCLAPVILTEKTSLDWLFTSSWQCTAWLCRLTFLMWCKGGWGRLQMQLLPRSTQLFTQAPLLAGRFLYDFHPRSQSCAYVIIIIKYNFQHIFTFHINF